MIASRPDTIMMCVAKGGRLGKAISTIESLLSVKLLLTVRDGELRPAGLARIQNKGIHRLYEFVRSASHIQDLAIAYSTIPDDAQRLADYVVSLFLKAPRISRLGPMLGVYAGPGTLVIAIRKAK